MPLRIGGAIVNSSTEIFPANSQALLIFIIWYHMNKSNKYVLIFWPQSNEYSIEREDKVKKVIKVKFLKPGWCGELPWLEKNSVDIYEAKIVEISRNKSLLESRIVCSSGNILPKILKKNLVEENRSIKKKMNVIKKIQQQNSKRAAIYTASLKDFSSTLNDEDSINTNQENEILGNIRSENIQNDCENCQKCICKNWAPFLTDDILNFLEMFIGSMKAAKEKVDDNIGIEIHPRSGWKMPKSDLVIIDAKSGNNSHHYIRNLLEYFLTADELISCGTSNNIFKKHVSLQTAITGYIQTKLNTLISTSEFTRVVNRRIRTLKDEKFMTQSQKDIIKHKKRELLHKSRKDKKLTKGPNDNVAKKGQRDDCVSFEHQSTITTNQQSPPARSPLASATHDIEQPCIMGSTLANSSYIEPIPERNLLHSNNTGSHADHNGIDNYYQQLPIVNHYPVSHSNNTGPRVNNNETYKNYQVVPVPNDYPASHSFSTGSVINGPTAYDQSHNSSINTSAVQQNLNNPLWSLQMLY
ncbi:hypothetical protein PV326_012226 [Microctonus aethiopoides]|nr:hypothetical protein PV326_012226 [Microctonus aethiopoides]